MLTIWHFQRMPGHIAPPDGVDVLAVSVQPIVVLMVPAIEMNLLKKGIEELVLRLLYHYAFTKISENKYLKLKSKWLLSHLAAEKKIS